MTVKLAAFTTVCQDRGSILAFVARCSPAAQQPCRTVDTCPWVRNGRSGMLLAAQQGVVQPSVQTSRSQGGSEYSLPAALPRCLLFKSPVTTGVEALSETNICELFTGDHCLAVVPRKLAPRGWDSLAGPFPALSQGVCALRWRNGHVARPLALCPALSALRIECPLRALNLARRPLREAPRITRLPLASSMSADACVSLFPQRMGLRGLICGLLGAARGPREIAAGPALHAASVSSMSPVPAGLEPGALRPRI